MSRFKIRCRSSVCWLVYGTLLMGVLLSACAPEDLDYTPTAPPPTATSTPTPRPVDEVDPKEARLAAIKQLVPLKYTAAGLDWTLNTSRGENGIGTPPPRNLGNGVGIQMLYADTSGHEFRVSFVVFDTPEQALAQYDIMRDIRREQLRVSQPLPALPTPNLVGGNTQFGSEALFIVEGVYLVEVFVQNYDSVRGDPRNAVAIASYRIVQDAIARFSTPNTKEERIEALKGVIPTEITVGEATFAQLNVLEVTNIDDAIGAKATYRDEGRTTVIVITYLAYDLPDTAGRYYTTQQRQVARFDLSLNLSQATPDANLAELTQNNRSLAGDLSAAVQIVQVGNYFMDIRIERSRGSARELLPAISQLAVDTLNAGIAAYEAASGEPGDVETPTPEPATEATRTPESRPVG